MAIGAIFALGAILVVEGPRPAAVTVQGEGPVRYMAGAGKLTLYVFDGDGGQIECVDDCARAWPPLLAGKSDKPIGDWNLVPRPDGQIQWAYKGRPVYGYQNDQTPGQAAGDGIMGWHALEYAGVPPAVAVPTSAAVRRRVSGFFLTDYRGHSLYTFSQDADRPACIDECLSVWPPLRAPALAATVGEWAPVDRADGVRQWSYRGKLVYTYSGDLTPSDALGADPEKLWTLLAPPAEAHPAKAGGSETPRPTHADSSSASQVLQEVRR
jgi:predicted lipoprotein with Yx(FWY)xxD motif